MPKGVYKRVIPVWNKGKKTGANPEHSKRMKGKPSWNKGLTKEDHPSISKMGFQKGHKPVNWKGDDACTRGIHLWVEDKKGKAKEHKCVDCGEQAVHWSNKDHTYKRNLEDYQARCYKCHKIYDKRR